MNKKGFTLIEMLVAMTIFAIIIGMGMVSYQGARRSARDGKRKADLEQVRSALEMYRADEGSYPTGPLSSGDTIGTYMTIPADPVVGRNYYYLTSGSSYNICAAIEGSDGTMATSCGNNCGSSCNYQLTNP